MNKTYERFEYNADMLKSEHVQHLTQYWHKQPTPEIFDDAEKYIQQFSQLKSVSIFCACLSAIALHEGHEYFQQLSTALFQLGIHAEIPINDLMPWHVPYDGIDSHVFSSYSCPAPKNGRVRGFVHGHYRLFTPANLANLLVAKEQCDELVVGVEANWRTSNFKNVQPVVRNWMKFQWLLASGFDGIIVQIKRAQYSDEGYERLLQRVKPDIYFGNKSLPHSNLKQMEQRAKKSHAKFVVLPKQVGKSTSEFLKI